MAEQKTDFLLLLPGLFRVEHPDTPYQGFKQGKYVAGLFSNGQVQNFGYLEFTYDGYIVTQSSKYVCFHWSDLTDLMVFFNDYPFTNNHFELRDQLIAEYNARVYAGLV